MMKGLKPDGLGLEVSRSFVGLRRQFLFPPFSVLRTMEGEWQKRKRMWLALGIQSEVGRGGGSTPPCLPQVIQNKEKSLSHGDISGQAERFDCQLQHKIDGLTFRATGFMAKVMEERGGGTSIFDPVLCELVYRWFCPEGGQIIDPFAGGSVRGIVAHVLGYKYWGSELRPEQVEANKKQAAEICPEANRVPVMVSGAMLRQRFHPCTCKYVNDVCHGRCCEGSDGIKVVVHPSEQQRIEQAGATVIDGFILADQRGLCPFKTNEGRCSIHGSSKPFGCQASPFTLTNKGTLIVRNRYRLLRCYGCDGAMPAHEAHRWSLAQIFGESEATRIVKKAAAGIDSIAATMPINHYTILADNHNIHNGIKTEIPQAALSWHCGDALDLLSDAPKADLIFSCPPYGNLEMYSDLPNDLSGMEYPQFRAAYLEIIKLSVDKLRENRFACFVVGNFRDKATGFYHDFVGDTVRCFGKAGAGFYNDIVLVTATGSLPVRVGKQFQAGRKVGKTHQNVLVFYKGNPKAIKGIFGTLTQGERA